MPLVAIDTIRGQYDQAQLTSLLDAVQDAVVEGFGVPTTDRYQIITQHEPFELVALDTGGEDIVVAITENGDADWSFGHGTAQFLTGEL